MGPFTDLSGEWSLTDAEGGFACSLHLPGDGISALFDAGLIPDPYWGRNEYDVRWIGERDWIARRAFEHDGGPCDLLIDGLDTVAEVAINGQVVLRAANAHRRWRVPADGLLKGRNEITILFRSSVKAAADAQAGQPFYVPYQTVNGPIPNANMLRKPQCDFGWDWNVALAPFGVWGDVRLVPRRPTIRDIQLSQSHEAGAVEVTALVTVERGAGEVVVTLCGQTAKATPKAGTARVTLRLDAPALWWPVGQGAPTLHDLTVNYDTAKETRRVGFRSLDLVSEPDAAGRSFGFRVNGRAVFAKGANWIPADALHGRVTREGVRDLLQSAVDANMNMIRVWGGGRYEPDWFYDLCDEMGLMVWQDFMFACHLYPSTPAFLAEIDAEVRDVVRRIGFHACIALWCGDNELIGALTWFEESRKDRDRYLVSYDRLNRTIETALTQTQPDANWWPSSPSPGPLSFGDAWHDDGSGDMHFWSVWHEGRSFDHYRDVAPRFCSEFGFQSYPSMDVVRTFAAPEDFNIAAPVLESHQKNPGGNARIAETMFRYFRFPNRFEDFVYVSQVQQALAIQTAVSHWRSLKPHCMGTLYWQLNDTWPVASWSSLDYGGGWKILHYLARRFNAPVAVTIVPTADAFLLRSVNDTGAAVDLRVSVTAIDGTGAGRPLACIEGRVAPDAAIDLLHIPRADVEAHEFLHVQWSGDGGEGQDVVALKPYKAYDLLPPNVRAAVATQQGDVILTLHSDALAHFVTVEADVPGRFSDNGFALLPGAPRQIRFKPKTPGALAKFTLRDLHSATYTPTQ